MIEKIIEGFFKIAEIGDWDTFSIKEASNKFNIKEEELIKHVPSKEYFLIFYNDYVDKKVLESISIEDIENSNSDEVLQEYLMFKLEYMNKYKLAMANIINASLINKKFIILSLKSNKESIKKFVNRIGEKQSYLKRKVLIKLTLILWMVAFNKWLYEDKKNETSYSLINKGIQRIKKNLKIF